MLKNKQNKVQFVIGVSYSLSLSQLANVLHCILIIDSTVSFIAVYQVESYDVNL